MTATWPTNVASVAVSDQLARRAAQMQVLVTLILQQLSTMVPAQNWMNVVCVVVLGRFMTADVTQFLPVFATAKVA